MKFSTTEDTVLEYRGYSAVINPYLIELFDLLNKKLVKSTRAGSRNQARSAALYLLDTTKKNDFGVLVSVKDPRHTDSNFKKIVIYRWVDGEIRSGSLTQPV